MRILIIISMIFLASCSNKEAMSYKSSSEVILTITKHNNTYIVNCKGDISKPMSDLELDQYIIDVLQPNVNL